MQTSRVFNYIDLFSGAGGFSYGFNQNGFNNIFSVVNEPNCCQTYRYNFPNHILIEKNISNLVSKEIETLTKDVFIDVIIGGPP